MTALVHEVRHDLVDAVRGDGTPFSHQRVTLGNGYGIVVICTVGDHLVMVTQPRPAPGLAKSLELPRGGTLDHSRAEALRELREETGVTSGEVSDSVLLGYLHPDTGIVGNTVAVWWFKASPRLLAAKPELESGAVASLVPVQEVLNSTEITCGMTLAALELLRRARGEELPAMMTTPRWRAVLKTGSTGQLRVDPNQTNTVLMPVAEPMDQANLAGALATILDWADHAGLPVLDLVNHTLIDAELIEATINTVARNRRSYLRLQR